MFHAVRALASTALAAGLLVAQSGAWPQSAAAVDVPYPPGSIGADISWPQCDPQMLPSGRRAYGVVGVTGGRPFTNNPCLASQAAWARSTGSPLSLYVNLDDNLDAARAARGPRACAPGDDVCHSYDYGAATVAAAVDYAHTQNADARTWWLDVEVLNDWTGDGALNSAVVTGAADALRARGLTAGAYSTTSMWLQITGGMGLRDGLPVWVAGPGDLDESPAACDAAHSFTGGPVWLVQFPADTLDGDYACGGVAPRHWLAAADGGLFASGGVAYLGSAGGHPLNAPVVATTATPDGGGYWLVGADGGVFAFGDAPFLGSAGGQRLSAPVAGMASTPSGHGYWLAAGDGGVFAYGDAPFLGSVSGHPLSAPVIGVAPTPSGGGYWLVGADGGVFAFGDAVYRGGLGGVRVTAPIVGIASTTSGKGYWLASADGGVFSFGDAPYLGNAIDAGLGSAVVGIARTADGRYALATSGGGVVVPGAFPTFATVNARLAQPVVAIAAASPRVVQPGRPETGVLGTRPDVRVKPPQL